MLTESLKGAELASSSYSILTERRDVDISEVIPEKGRGGGEKAVRGVMIFKCTV